MLGRTLLILVALSLAAIGGVLFVIIASLSTGLGRGTLEAFAGFAVFVWMLPEMGAPVEAELAPIVGALVALVLVVPLMMSATLMAILAEGFGWRSLTVHMVGNAALAVATGGAIGLAGALVEARAVTGGQTQALAVLAATGAVIGLVYWAVAGRTARGFLRAGPPPATPAPGP